MKPETSCEQGDQELSYFERGRKISLSEAEREEGERGEKERERE